MTSVGVPRYFDSVACYFFNTAPPLESRLYFKQKTLWEMLLYGHMATPYEPPQFTVYPSDGQVGRWTLNADDDKVEAMRKIAITPPATVKERLINLLPGMLVRYQDFSTEKFMVWRLTDDVILRDNQNDLRLGVWPD